MINLDKIQSLDDFNQLLHEGQIVMTTRMEKSKLLISAGLIGLLKLGGILIPKTESLSVVHSYSILLNFIKRSEKN